MLRRVTAIRYVLPLREGSSVPALVEADDLGLYVVKLRGAGQGPKALIAELITGELARAAELRVPDLVFVELPNEIGASEPDPELCLPLEKSAGLNIGLDYLPGSITFDPVADPAPDAALASRIVLLDALMANVDRTPRNPNLLTWHGNLWLIDHGASLYFHHGWSTDGPLEGTDDRFAEVREHVLLPWASRLGEAAEALTSLVTRELIDAVVQQIPALWLEGHGASTAEVQRRYADWLRARVGELPSLLEEAERARHEPV